MGEIKTYEILGYAREEKTVTPQFGIIFGK